jgi:hypothetical protein
LLRDEAEGLAKEAMARKTVAVMQGNTRIETKCGKCDAPDRIAAAPGQTLVEYTCKECGRGVHEWPKADIEIWNIASDHSGLMFLVVMDGTTRKERKLTQF